GRGRLERAHQPARTAGSVGRDVAGRAGLRHPLLVDVPRLAGVDRDVAVRVAGRGGADADGLVPAVHAGDGVGVDREGEVLVDAGVGPPDPGGVRVCGLVRLD